MSIKVLFDTNVLLDVVLERMPWASEAALLLDAAERGHVRGYVSSHTITTFHYVIARARGRQIATTARMTRIRPSASAWSSFWAATMAG